MLLIDLPATMHARHHAARAAQLLPEARRMIQQLLDYRIDRQLGTGAGALVYAATHPETGEKVAIKRVVRNSAKDDRFVQQLETEYKVGSAVNHPYVRRSFRLERIKKWFMLREAILVMELVDGFPLHEARPDRLDRFFWVCSRVAEGLGAMHAAGYIHSDFKPSNILVGRGGLVKIIDLGQACSIGTRKERIQGTPDFIAPEQVARRSLTVRTDVFNFGASMYWLLTNEYYPTDIRGYDRVARSSVFDLMAAGKAPAPHELNTKVPPALSQLVMQCCDREPANRPATMADLVARLDAQARVWKAQHGGGDQPA